MTQQCGKHTGMECSNILTYSATLGVEVCGIYKEFFLPDCPADSRGCLSHHYQKQNDRLDEAGSYGYICRVDIPKSSLDDSDEQISVTLSCDEGFSLFDRKSGRYPVGVWVTKKITD